MLTGRSLEKHIGAGIDEEADPGRIGKDVPGL